jgi:hypothetical protein
MLLLWIIGGCLALLFAAMLAGAVFAKPGPDGTA